MELPVKKNKPLLKVCQRNTFVQYKCVGGEASSPDIVPKKTFHAFILTLKLKTYFKS
jgi:hypothetical protein